jgi:membrane-associated phospholipid phosphatase
MNAFVIEQIKEVSVFGNDFIPPVILLLVLFVYFSSIGLKKDTLILTIACFSYVYASVLKLIFREPRPSLIGLTIRTPADLYGFPSSHVIFYVSFFGFLLYICLTRKKINKWIRILISLLCVYLIVLIGASRVLLGVHTVLDALGGYVFGAVYLASLIILDKRLKRYLKKSIPEDQNKNN